VEIDAKYREVVGLEDLDSAKAKAFRRAPGAAASADLGCNWLSKSAVADFDQPTARRMRPNAPVSALTCGLSVTAKLN
jgi:hypothetical protein